MCYLTQEGPLPVEHPGLSLSPGKYSSQRQWVYFALSVEWNSWVAVFACSHHLLSYRLGGGAHCVADTGGGDGPGGTCLVWADVQRLRHLCSATGRAVYTVWFAGVWGEWNGWLITVWNYLVLEPDPWEPGGGSVMCARNAGTLLTGSWLHTYVCFIGHTNHNMLV